MTAFNLKLNPNPLIMYRNEGNTLFAKIGDNNWFIDSLDKEGDDFNDC